MRNSDKVREKIKEQRELKKLRQEDMAEKLNMSVTGYAKIERGQTQISFDRLMQIAEVLEMNVTQLLPLDDSLVTFTNSNCGDIKNAQNVNFAMGDANLQSEVMRLNEIILGKNELLDARDREIEALKEQIISQNKVIKLLEGN